MRYYELTYLISPELSEEEVKTFQEKINSLISQEGGILDQVSRPIKKKLGYQIKKKRSFFLGSLSLYLNPEKSVILEKKLRKEKDILRFMILTKPRTKKVLVRDKKIPEKSITKPRKRPKVELKEIEKKLEEILGE